MDKMPADWAIERARTLYCEGYELVYGASTVEQIKDSDVSSPWKRLILKFATYIEAHEEAPVDPDLILAREAAAEFWLGDENWQFSENCKAGDRDKTRDIRIPLAAIKLARERGVLCPPPVN